MDKIKLAESWKIELSCASFVGALEVEVTARLNDQALWKSLCESCSSRRAKWLKSVKKTMVTIAVWLGDQELWRSQVVVTVWLVITCFTFSS